MEGKFMKRVFLLVVVLLSLLLSSSTASAFWYYYPSTPSYGDGSASEANQNAQGDVTRATAYTKVMAKTVPDECYYGVGSKSNQYPMTTACTGTFKRNDGYVWGMTQYKDKIFFGTASNVACLVAQNYLGTASAVKDPDYVCEMNDSAYSFYDFRSPNFYMYTMAGGLKKLDLSTDTSGLADKMRQVTIGFRAAGVHPAGIVMIAGPMAAAYGSGINMFFFSASSGKLIGATNFKGGENIRNIFTASDGHVYIGVGSADQIGGTNIGQVYKWKVDPLYIALTGDTSSLYNWELVGTGIDAEAAQLVEHEGRLFAGSWPDENNAKSYGGLWMSPIIPSGGLTAANATGWTKIMSYDKYDPYPLAAKRYGGGAMKSFGGYLYWGTMHVPGMNYQAWTTLFGSPSSGDSQSILQLADNTNRALSLFRGKNFGSTDRTKPQTIQLLYGGKNGGYFTTYVTSTDWRGNTTGSWNSQMNLMNLRPLYGEGGFNNDYGNYCWSMAIYNNHLYVGTMDYSAVSQSFLGTYPYFATFGADLYRFNDANSAALKITDDGFGNPNQYGFRTMAVTSDALILGTAGNANLVPGGGWELIRLKEASWSDSFVYNGPYRMEAEKATLQGFQVTEDDSASEDNVVVSNTTWCGADFTFAGNSGTYDIAIRYYDPGTKAGSIMRFYVNGALIASKTLTQSKGWYFWHIDKVALSATNKVELHTTLDRNAYSTFKVDFIDMVPDYY